MAAPTRVSVAEGYALWAETWDATPSPIVALEERTLLPWISRLRPHRTIDAGCGTGRWAARLGALGIDTSEAMLRVAARKEGMTGRLAAADACALPCADGSADLVLCSLTLGHLADPQSGMREFARVLQPGGTLLLTDFHPDAISRGWRRTFRRDGRVYELETRSYTLADLCTAAPLQLKCLEAIDAKIAELERPLFERAGRPELFEAACARPAVLLTRWERL